MDEDPERTTLPSRVATQELCPQSAEALRSGHCDRERGLPEPIKSRRRPFRLFATSFNQLSTIATRTPIGRPRSLQVEGNGSTAATKQLAPTYNLQTTGEPSAMLRSTTTVQCEARSAHDKSSRMPRQANRSTQHTAAYPQPNIQSTTTDKIPIESSLLGSVRQQHAKCALLPLLAHPSSRLLEAVTTHTTHVTGIARNPKHFHAKEIATKRTTEESKVKPEKQPPSICPRLRPATPTLDPFASTAFLSHFPSQLFPLIDRHESADATPHLARQAKAYTHGPMCIPRACSIRSEGRTGLLCRVQGIARGRVRHMQASWRHSTSFAQLCPRLTFIVYHPWALNTKAFSWIFRLTSVLSPKPPGKREHAVETETPSHSGWFGEPARLEPSCLLPV